MKKVLFFAVLPAIVVLLLAGCGADGSSGSSGGGVGTLSVDVTDAKSVLPDGTARVSITFDEVLVHKSGGGWQTCELIADPYTVDLLQLHSGTTAVLAPPCSISSGKYTQIRIVVSHAEIEIDGLVYDLGVPSSKLKIDKNLTFDMEHNGFAALTVDFDPGQSITGTPPDLSLKPVIHVVRNRDATTMCGSIDPVTFGDPAQDALVTVNWDEDSDGSDEVYTQIAVEKESDTDPTAICIFWLDPQKDYDVIVDVDGTVVFNETVLSAQLTPGDTFSLNDFTGDNPI